jgi:hypothetical protein
VWWGGALRPPTSRGEDDVTAAALLAKGEWDLHYDAKSEHGIETVDVRRVRFVSGRKLEDVDEEARMRWRREGVLDDDAGDSDDDDDDSDEDDLDPNLINVAAVPENAEVSLASIARAQRDVDQSVEQRGGVGVERAGLDAFGRMPLDRQRRMAEAFASMKDGLSSAFAALQERHGADYAITKEDLDEIMRGMRS